MTDKPVQSQEERQSGLAPETHNGEQDDHRSQAQEVAEQAREAGSAGTSPLESVKGPNESGLPGGSTEDTIDHMRDMQRSGRIDMDAYRGEPNHDDNEGKYGASNEVDPDLPNEND